MKQKVKLTFDEEVLGTASSDKEIHAEFIASKAPGAPTRNEEISAIIEEDGLEAAQEKGRTIFPRVDGRPILYDYQIKGFFKDACRMLRYVPGTRSKKMTAYKRKIDGTIFVTERSTPFELSGDLGDCQRPLRAETAQGERVSLASSETVPAGSSVTFTIECLNGDDWATVEEWLDYGAKRGIGQWRNSGKGKFHWEKVDDATA